MPGPLALAAVAGGVNILGNLGKRSDLKNTYAQMYRDIVRMASEERRERTSQSTTDVGRQLAASGLQGSGVISTIISDLNNTLTQQINQQRDAQLRQLRSSYIAQRSQLPGFAETLAGGISSGAQTYLNASILQGGMDDLTRSTPELYGSGDYIDLYLRSQQQQPGAPQIQNFNDNFNMFQDYQKNSYGIPQRTLVG